MDFVEIILALVAACSIPSAITSLAIRRMERRFDERENTRKKEEADREKAQEKSMVLVVQGVTAAIALGEATAHAIQLGHANGDMEAALDYARQVKHKQKDFLTERAAKSIYDK